MAVKVRLRMTYDPYDWSGTPRTYREAHKYIKQNWGILESGDVIDVEFILGETDTCKISERLTAYDRGN